MPPTNNRAWHGSTRPKRNQRLNPWVSFLHRFVTHTHTPVTIKVTEKSQTAKEVELLVTALVMSSNLAIRKRGETKIISNYLFVASYVQALILPPSPIPTTMVRCHAEAVFAVFLACPRKWLTVALCHVHGSLFRERCFKSFTFPQNNGSVWVCFVLFCSQVACFWVLPPPPPPLLGLSSSACSNSQLIKSDTRVKILRQSSSKFLFH